MGWFSKKKPPASEIEAKVAAFVDEAVDAMGSYECVHCGGEHVAFELGFRWPDVAVVTGAAHEEDPEDRIVLGGRTYVRGTLRIPIRGEQRDFAVGIWAALDGADRGTLANQSALLAPLLGAAVRVVPGVPGMRPTFELVDHPLARAQRDGVSSEQVTLWRSNEAHRNEGEELGEPFTASLDAQGWELISADEVGKPPCTDDFDDGDFAKVFVRLMTVGEDGLPMPLVAGWWIAVDHVDGGRVSGTLHSVPKVPTTLSPGTRMWPSPDQIFQRQPP